MILTTVSDNIAPTVQNSALNISIMWYIVEALGAVIALFLAIIASFLKSLIKKIDETNKAVIELTINFKNQDTRCTQVHRIIDDRLKDYSKMVHDHETEIEILKNRK